MFSILILFLQKKIQTYCQNINFNIKKEKRKQKSNKFGGKTNIPKMQRFLL
jgi:ligand-binding sensor protein